MPLTGGTPRPFLGESSETPSWSPDGTRSRIFTDGRGCRDLAVTGRTATGADARGDLTRFPTEDMHNHNPVWSPDGQWIYFVHGHDPTEEMDIWRIRPSGESLERTDRQAVRGEFSGAARRAHADLRGACGGRYGTVALDARCETGVTRRVTWVSSATPRWRPVATAGASWRRSPTRPRPCGVCRCSIGPPRIATPSRTRCPRCARWRRGSAGRRSYLSTGGVGDSLWRVQDGQAYGSLEGADMPLVEPPAVSPDGSRVAVVMRREGSGGWPSCRRTAPTCKRWPPIEIQRVPGRGRLVAGRPWIVAGAATPRAGLFKIPVDGGAPVRLVTGQAVNPVWSPAGNLIAYGAGPVVSGRYRPLGATGRHSGRITGRARSGRRLSLPAGWQGTRVLPRPQSPDFWLLDLARQPHASSPIWVITARPDVRRHTGWKGDRVRPLTRECGHRPDRSAALGGTRSRPKASASTAASSAARTAASRRAASAARRPST